MELIWKTTQKLYYMGNPNGNLPYGNPNRNIITGKTQIRRRPSCVSLPRNLNGKKTSIMQTSLVEIYMKNIQRELRTTCTEVTCSGRAV